METLKFSFIHYDETKTLSYTSTNGFDKTFYSSKL